MDELRAIDIVYMYTMSMLRATSKKEENVEEVGILCHAGACDVVDR